MPRAYRTHWRSVRLFVNAGLQFPACFANSPLLDTERGHLKSTGDKSLVTCSRCLKLIEHSERVLRFHNRRRHK